MPKEQEYPVRESFRAPRDLAKAISQAARDEGLPRAETIRALLWRGLEQLPRVERRQAREAGR